MVSAPASDVSDVSDVTARQGSAALVHVTAPDDPKLAALARLLDETFADPDVVLGLDRLQQFVAEPPSDRAFHVVVARGAGGELAGGVVFSYVPASNCGFSEYIAVARTARGSGVARALMAERRATLDADARQHGYTACRGVFVEVEHPLRTPPAVVESERETALDAHARWRFFQAQGFRRVDVPYVQPPLAPGKAPVDYLDLLFLPWDADAAAAGAIPAAWVRETVKPVWARWTPDTYAAHHAALAERLGEGTVALRPLFPIA